MMVCIRSTVCHKINTKNCAKREKREICIQFKIFFIEFIENRLLVIFKFIKNALKDFQFHIIFFYVCMCEKKISKFSFFC